MSKWGEMFHALSQEPATIATIATKGEHPPSEGDCRNRRNCCAGLERKSGVDAAKGETQPPVERADDLEERAAIIEEGAAVPRSWAEGFAAICCMAPPTGFSPARWQRIVDATGHFLDRWADAAIACGWSDLDVFGCDPDRPDARFDAMGLAMLLDRAEVVAVDEFGADLVTTTGARQRYRRRPLPKGTISLWELAKR